MFSNLFNRLRRKKEFKDYKFQVVDFDLPIDGKVQYAQWLHPGEFGNEVKQENVNFYRNYIKKGDFAIDIGANEGDTTVPMALAVGKEGLTLALEPNPHVFKVLSANTALNQEKTSIVSLNVAATAYDGNFTFGSGDPSYGNGGIVGFTHNQARNVRYTLDVTGINLENYLRKNYGEWLRKLSLIKIDAEGYDKEIIKTLDGIIREYKPTLITECFGPATSEEKIELYAVLTGLGYTVYQMAGFIESPLVEITADALIGKRTFELLALPKKG